MYTAHKVWHTQTHTHTHTHTHTRRCILAMVTICIKLNTHVSCERVYEPNTALVFYWYVLIYYAKIIHLYRKLLLYKGVFWKQTSVIAALSFSPSASSKLVCISFWCHWCCFSTAVLERACFGWTAECSMAVAPLSSTLCPHDRSSYSICVYTYALNSGIISKYACMNWLLINCCMVIYYVKEYDLATLWSS